MFIHTFSLENPNDFHVQTQFMCSMRFCNAIRFGQCPIVPPLLHHTLVDGAFKSKRYYQKWTTEHMQYILNVNKSIIKGLI